MVKAIRVYAHGGTEVLKFEDFALPACGDNEIRMKNHAIGMNYIETYFRTGLYQPPSLPFTPGGESAGEVIAVGKDVKGFKVGDRVATTVGFGSYAEERNVPAAGVVKLPKGISYEVAAASMLKGLTAEYLLHRTFPVKKGQTVLIQAAAGATGQLLCKWAKAIGAIVIGTVGSAEKAKIAAAHCHHVINYSTEDYVKRVNEITKGEKCHVAYDGVGKATFPSVLDCLRPFGMLVSFGNASGAVEAFNVGGLAAKGGLYVTRPTLMWHTGNPKTLASMSKRLFKALEDGTISVPINARYKLSDVAKAHTMLETRQTTGATILLP